MNQGPKIISYGDSFLPGPGISDHKRKRKRIKAFVTIISIVAILAFLKLNLLANKTEANNTRIKKIMRHKNPCRHVTPEPEIILQEKFDSNDYFFPYSYKERICASPNKTGNQDQDQELKDLQSCFSDYAKGNHHCVTRYKALEVVRMPYPGNLTSEHWKVEKIHVAVACECTRTEAVKTYGT